MKHSLFLALVVVGLAASFVRSQELDCLTPSRCRNTSAAKAAVEPIPVSLNQAAMHFIVSRPEPDAVAKSPRSESLVLPQHIDNNPVGVSYEEWESRVEAAAAFLHVSGADNDLYKDLRITDGARALYLYGFDDLAAQCVMVRVKGQPANNQLLVMVEWGIFFDEVTASDGLVVVTFDGHVIDSKTGAKTKATASTVNMGCLPVAVPIFNERPD
eukprot:17037-Heterococcus_DN1.PRE.1